LAISTPLPSLRRNYLFGGIQAVVGAVFPLVMLAYSARILGPESLGKYYFANSLAAYFLFAACLGIPIYGIREIAKVRSNPEGIREVFRELFLINLISSSVIWAIYLTLVMVVPQFRAEGMLFGIVGIVILNNALSLDYLYMGLERQDFLAYRSILSKSISLGLLVWLVRDSDDYLWLAGIGAIAAVFNSVLSFKGLRYLKGFSKSSLNLKRHLRPLILFSLSTIFANLYLSFDSVLVGLLSTAHEVGLYSASIRPSRMFVLLLMGLTGALLPRLAYLLKDQNLAAHGSLQKKSFEMTFMLAIPVALTFIASSRAVIALVFGSEFSEATPAFALAAPLILINCFTAFQSYQILIPSHKERGLMISVSVAAFAGILTNLALIPNFGHTGAVIAALVAETSCLGVQLLLIRRMGRGHFVFSNAIWKYFGAGILMASLQWWSLGDGSAPLTQVVAVWALSTVVYFVVLWVLQDPVVRGAVTKIKRGLVH